MDLDADTYRLLFDANPLPMFVSDRETLKIVIVNRAACEHYGWSRDEFLAMTIRDIRPVEEIPAFEASYADPTKHSKPTYSRSGRHRTKDGRIIEVILEIAPLEVGGRHASLAVVTDVTGISQAERRFRLLVEHSSDGIAITNAQNIIEYISPAGERLLGFPANEVVGTNAGLRAHPHDVPTWVDPPPGDTKHFAARIAHRDGSWRWIESSTTNLTHDPAVRGYVSNYRDITERKLAEQALVESEKSFRTLFERTPMAMFVHRGGRFEYANPAAVAMLGLRGAGDLIGHDVLEFVHPDDREIARKRLELLEREGSTSPNVGRMMRADGTVFSIEVQGIRLDFDGEPSSVVFGQDVTERHQMFARMALADRMLSVGTLAAGVAHEINNPLAYVSSNLELLAAELPNITLGPRSRLTDVALRSLVTDSREGVERMRTIVRDLRSLSRQEDETKRPVDVVAVLGSAIKMAHNEIRHRARVVTAYADGIPLVQADASRLNQVFLNLLLNAAQAIADGRAGENEIRIRAAAIDDGARVRIDIADTGIGIAPHIMRRIFDPFFTTKAPGIGTGLGLSISHQIVKAMDGEITVESTPGGGSTFTVTLPTAANARLDKPAASQLAAEISARILLVDDEPAVGRSLSILLAPETEVVAVTRADDAIARIARGERFDAILCDLMMPEVSGVELYHELVRAAPECMARVIFMTGGAFTPQAREFLAKTDRPYLEKPFSEAQLRRAIESVVR